MLLYIECFIAKTMNNYNWKGPHYCIHKSWLMSVHFVFILCACYCQLLQLYIHTLIILVHYVISNYIFPSFLVASTTLPSPTNTGKHIVMIKACTGVYMYIE